MHTWSAATMLAVLCAALSSTGAAMKRGSYRLHDVFTVEHDTEADLVEEFLSNSDVRLEGMWLAQEESLGTSGQKDVMHTNETVTIVTSAVELIMAVNQSDPYIEIREHLNLTGFYLPDGNAHVLGDIPGAVLSIQGNCSEAVPFVANLTGAPLLPMQPRQCVIVTDAPLMTVSHGSLWVDNLYIRRQDTRRGWWGALVQEREGRWFPWQEPVKMWMTNVNMQADGDGLPDCHACAIDQFAGQLYAEGCKFSEFEGGQVAAFGAGQTSASFVNSEFANNTIAPNAFWDGNHAVIEARKQMLSDGFAAAKVMVRLEGTDMTNNSAQHPLVATGGTQIAKNVFYSDHDLEVFMPELRPNTSKVQSLDQTPADTFLDMHDPFILGLKHTLYYLPRAAFKKRDPHSRSHSHKEPKYPRSKRTILMLLLIYILLALAFVWACCGFVPRFFPNARRRARSRAHQQGDQQGSVPHGSGPSPGNHGVAPTHHPHGGRSPTARGASPLRQSPIPPGSSQAAGQVSRGPRRWFGLKPKPTLPPTSPTAGPSSSTDPAASRDNGDIPWGLRLAPVTVDMPESLGPPSPQHPGPPSAPANPGTLPPFTSSGSRRNQIPTPRMTAPLSTEAPSPNAPHNPASPGSQRTKFTSPRHAANEQGSRSLFSPRRFSSPHGSPHPTTDNPFVPPPTGSNNNPFQGNASTSQFSQAPSSTVSAPVQLQGNVPPVNIVPPMNPSLLAATKQPESPRRGHPGDDAMSQFSRSPSPRVTAHGERSPRAPPNDPPPFGTHHDKLLHSDPSLAEGPMPDKNELPLGLRYAPESAPAAPAPISSGPGAVATVAQGTPAPTMSGPAAVATVAHPAPGGTRVPMSTNPSRDGTSTLMRSLRPSTSGHGPPSAAHPMVTVPPSHSRVSDPDYGGPPTVGAPPSRGPPRRYAKFPLRGTRALLSTSQSPTRHAESPERTLSGRAVEVAKAARESIGGFFSGNTQHQQQPSSVLPSTSTGPAGLHSGATASYGPGKAPKRPPHDSDGPTYTTEASAGYLMQSSKFPGAPARLSGFSPEQGRSQPPPPGHKPRNPDPRMTYSADNGQAPAAPQLSGFTSPSRRSPSRRKRQSLTDPQTTFTPGNEEAPPARPPHSPMFPQTMQGKRLAQGLTGFSGAGTSAPKQSDSEDPTLAQKPGRGMIGAQLPFSRPGHGKVEDPKHPPANGSPHRSPRKHRKSEDVHQTMDHTNALLGITPNSGRDSGASRSPSPPSKPQDPHRAGPSTPSRPAEQHRPGSSMQAPTPSLFSSAPRRPMPQPQAPTPALARPVAPHLQPLTFPSDGMLQRDHHRNGRTPQPGSGDRHRNSPAHATTTTPSMPATSRMTPEELLRRSASPQRLPSDEFAPSDMPGNASQIAALRSQLQNSKRNRKR